MAAVAVPSQKYSEVLREQLQHVYNTLLEQHNVETEHLRNSIWMLQNQRISGKTEDGGDGDDGEQELSSVLEGVQVAELDSSFNEVSFYKSDRALENWAQLSELILCNQEYLSNLSMRRDESEREEEVMDKGSEAAQLQFIDGLQMRKAWTVGLQEASMINRNRNYRVSNAGSSSTMRMNDILKDPSILQPFVLGPRNGIQLLWSFVGSIFILWDLVTIPLEMYDIPKFLAFLEVFGYVTFGFWILDMPTHLIFGREINGKVELRPWKLAREYLYSWFFLDLLVISIDVGLMLLQEAMSGGWRSARFLRTLRLLRLLRLLRVAKLQQQLTLLANRFLSAHAFMVMKVVAGLLMILAINHIIACCWFGIGSHAEVDGKSWILRSDLNKDDFAEAYAASIHWALTQFTPATNNIAPDNAVERFFAVWVILLAMGVFSSFISSITSTVSSLRTYRQEQSKKQSQLLRFFNERNLSTDLYSRVQEVVRRQGLFEVRLKETEVTLFSGVPQRLLILMHEEMFLPSVNALGFWPMWSHFEDQNFFRDVCHIAIKEHVVTPGQDAFMPGTDCQEVYVIQSGTMQYSAKPRVAKEADVLCMPCFWADWHHRGRMTAENAACYYIGVHAECFCNLATKNGGPLWQFLQIFGILLVGHIEGMDEEHTLMTDLGLPEEEFAKLTLRAQEFACTVRDNHKLDVHSQTNALNPLKNLTKPSFSRSSTQGTQSEILQCRM
ncbi:cGMP-gated cation channel alpha-1 (Cyclic nucleotide-gated cation channel 1) (Cyclic nucleotide-gated channel alpha-1) (CNG channel alpha-1) (CNG-1) (CNG1) (Cyclic nucleotide-gated channel [Durusdinium trenchii]|uniref:Photoreceptor (Rod photoreceptor cGMP-gated channel subunit alpha n=1 Tax=Durusdinium trenchii TaxID=1381693 RepID=A0ABP0LKQ2_9DINO